MHLLKRVFTNYVVNVIIMSVLGSGPLWLYSLDLQVEFPTCVYSY